MSRVKLYIKHMTSLRCKLFIEEKLEEVGVRHAVVKLGVVELQEELTEDQHLEFERRLRNVGLELVYRRSLFLVERIKILIINIVYHTLDFPRTNFSDYLSKKLGYNYTYLSNTFSREEGISIKEFIIYNKIEKTKEFLMHGEFTLTEIAYKLDYSSVAYLSNQFKKITGYSPTKYKKLNRFDRKYSDSL